MIFTVLRALVVPRKVFISLFLVNNEWPYIAETLLKSMLNDCPTDMSGLITNWNVRHAMTLR